MKNKKTFLILIIGLLLSLVLGVTASSLSSRDNAQTKVSSYSASYHSIYLDGEVVARFSDPDKKQVRYCYNVTATDLPEVTHCYEFWVNESVDVTNWKVLEPFVAAHALETFNREHLVIDPLYDVTVANSGKVVKQ